MAKTPSARVIAAMWLQDQLSVSVQASTLEPKSLTALAESRVSDEKAAKVREQIDKLAGKFIKRVDKIVEKFDNPTPAKHKPKPPPPRAKKQEEVQAE